MQKSKTVYRYTEESGAGTRGGEKEKDDSEGRGWTKTSRMLKC